MKKGLMAVVLLCLGLSVVAHAQLRGLGRIQGSVVDESGAPLDDVTVKASLPGQAGSIDVVSDKKGEWRVGGMARGEWEVTFEKPGYASRKAKVILPVELARTPPIAITLRKS